MRFLYSVKLILKARFLLLLALAMQASVLFKGLHHHEQVCLLTNSEIAADQQVLHAHTGEHEACAWDAFHLSSAAVALSSVFCFLPDQFSFVWAPLAPGQVTLLALQPSGRAPPAA